MRDSTAALAIRQSRDGIDGWFYPAVGRWLPRLAGGAGPPEPTPPADPPADPPAPGDPPPADPPADPPPADPPGDLGDAGKKALEQEREARKRAEKEMADLRREAKEREDAELSENERLKKENEENRAEMEAAKATARKANLLAALADKGLTGGKAEAAVRLLDSVEYDDEAKPTNLDAALEAAKATYGESTFTPDTQPKPPAPNLNGGTGNQPGPQPNLTTEELEAAEKARIDPSRFEGLKEVQTYEDWEQLNERQRAGQQQ